MKLLTKLDAVRVLLLPSRDQRDARKETQRDLRETDRQNRERREKQSREHRDITDREKKVCQADRQVIVAMALCDTSTLAVSV